MAWGANGIYKGMHASGNAHRCVCANSFEYITCVSVSIRKHINMYASCVDLYMSEICEILQANIHAYKSSARICMYIKL